MNEFTVKLNVKIVKGMDKAYCTLCGAYGYDKDHEYDGYVVNILGMEKYLCNACVEKLIENKEA